ncbi:MAG: hypothetical protein Q4A56_00245 [Porphyromonadaceae bacterium]|nr:hypothetical protein [Porphyromonadaceae bacterium]
MSFGCAPSPLQPLPWGEVASAYFLPLVRSGGDGVASDRAFATRPACGVAQTYRSIPHASALSAECLWGFAPKTV